MLPTRRAFLLSFAAIPALAGDPRFTDQLWSDIEPIYAKTLQHPFLQGLATGHLPKPRFHYYLVQDALYLKAFSEALHKLAAKAPRKEWSATLRDHAKVALAEAQNLHEKILSSYGVNPQQIARTTIAPTNYAYTNHFLRAAEAGSFTDGLAAVLPCYWIYQEVGRELKKKGSRDKDYQRWIDNYAGDEYAATVQQVLRMMNREAARMSPAAQAEARRLFTLSARYEYQFWDMAWRLEQWQP